MSSDTFSEGIVPGGLREKNEIKLLLCYLLKTLKRSLTRTQLNEILSEYSVANYFEVNGAVSELISGGQVISEIAEGDELITLTAKAELDVAAIERTLPRSVREKSVAAARPTRVASSQPRVSLAIPRIPSVPNSLPIKDSSFRGIISFSRCCLRLCKCYLTELLLAPRTGDRPRSFCRLRCRG